VINVEHVSKRFVSTLALDDVSFSIGKGEIVGFLGPNGAGKTTTMRVITGFIPATSGSVNVAGYDVFEQPVEVRKHIGYLTENVPLYPEMRVSEYLSYRCALKRVPFKDRPRRIDRSVELCHLGDVRKRIIGQLSKGYRQRVGLADALLADPPILILDEPTIGLDPHQIRQVRELIKRMAEDHTVLLSTHILPEVEAICNRILIINRGRIVGEGNPDELRARIHSGASILIEARGDGGRAKDSVKSIDGVKKVNGPFEAAGEGVFQLRVDASAEPELREKIFAAAVDGGWVLRELKMDATSLEDVFVKITTAETDTAASAEGNEKEDEAQN